MEPGESVDATLRRELHEELGLTDFQIGPLVWERTHIVPFIDGLWDGQHDRCFLVRTPHFEPAPTLTWEQLNAEHLMEIGWWTPTDVARFVPTEAEYFAPRRFASLYASVLAEGVPDVPFDASD
jgi:8-oxo-dGTP pyrophosphatase MutT (NUDIX family)